MGNLELEVPLFSHALRVLRVTHRCKQEDLARALGIAPGTLSAYENGTKEVDRALLDRAGEALRLPREAVDSMLAELQFQRTAARPCENGTQGEARRERVWMAALAGRILEGAVLDILDQIDRHTAVAEERRRAPLLWARLIARSPEARRALVEESPEFQTWALSELLCHESLRAAADSADRAIALAELALRVADLAPGEGGWRSRVAGYAWAHLGNAHRVKGDLRGADRAFTRAGELWEQGAPADPKILNEARVLGLEASLRREQRQFGQALALLDRALALADRAEAPYLLLGMAKLLGDRGDLEGALGALQRSEHLLASVPEKRLAFAARSNAVDFLSLLGHYEEAAERLPAVWQLAESLAGELDRLRLVWVHGRVAAGTGREEEGIAALEQVRREFGARRIAYDGALVSLELAVLYLKEGRTDRVKALAREMTPIFESEKVHREALAALALFARAAEQECATVELVQQLVRYLHQARHNPELRFRPGPSLREPAKKRSTAAPRTGAPGRVEPGPGSG
jgi:transcriptional regulator with XRE-family HTH domain